MKVRAWIAPVLLSLFASASAGGCAGSCSGGAGAAGAPAGTGSAVAVATASAAPSGSAVAAVGNLGLSAKDNDPEVVASVTKVLAECGAGFKPESGFEAACPAFKAFTELKIDAGAKDTTFVNLLDDKDDKVRWLGARGLAGFGSTYKSDKVLAERVVAAGEREKSDAVAGVLGWVIGAIDVGAIGIGERVKDLLLKAAAPDLLRRGIAASFVPANRECAPCIDATREVAEKDGTPPLRSTAVAALAAVPPGQGKAVCKTWVSLAGGADDIVAATAASRLTGGVTWSIFSANGWFATADYALTANKCADQLDEMLGAVEKRAKSGKITDDNWISALKGMLRPSLKASGRQKERAIAAARQIVEEKQNGPAVRSSALKLVAEQDAAGKTFAKKFVKDSDPMVAELAKSYAK